jgi:hypothetical protein
LATATIRFDILALIEINYYQILLKAARQKIGFDPEVTQAYENALNSINQKVTEVRNFAEVFKRSGAQ